MTRIALVEVIMEMPPGSTAADIREYVISALKTECGMRHPDDPMSNLNRDSIDVSGPAVRRKTLLETK